MAVVGDLEFFSQEFGFPTAMSNYPCAYCSATNFFGENEAPFTDMTKEAKWRETKLKETPKVDHPLMKVSGVSFWTIKLDLLHTLDLGVASHLYGNLIYDLVEDHVEGSSRPARLVKANQLILEGYAFLGIPAAKRLQKLSLSDLCTGGEDYPCLRHVKGRRVRWFSKVACYLADKFNVGDVGKHRLQAVKAMDKIYELADLPDHVWEPATHTEFAKACDKVVLHYSWLAKDALRKDLCRYSITQKHHLLACRYSEQCFSLSPRATWCYGPESFMSLCIQIANASVRGTSAAKLPTKVLGKFALAFHLLVSGSLSFTMEEEE